VAAPVNLVLFEPSELDRPLPRGDRRALHLLEVLRRRAGDTFDAGIAGGVRGKGTVVAIGPDAVDLAFAWDAAPLPPLPPLALVVGLPRPQTARDILRDATTLGATALHFVRTEKGEPSYATSSLWSSGDWRRHVLAGAEQAFDPRLPEVTHGQPLAAALATASSGPSALRLALDNYEAEIGLADVAVAPGQGVVLAVGNERGWSAADRATLRAAGFTLVHLGSRVLRTETACVVGLTLLRAKLGGFTPRH
jgi:16S rRNA (uracil1498-N3)-methyltransferase